MSKGTTKVRDDIIAAIQLAGHRLDINEIAAATGIMKSMISDSLWRMSRQGVLCAEQVRRENAGGKMTLLRVYSINPDWNGETKMPVVTKPSKMVAALPASLMLTFRGEDGRRYEFSVNDARYIHKQLGQLFNE